MQHFANWNAYTSYKEYFHSTVFTILFTSWLITASRIRFYIVQRYVHNFTTRTRYRENDKRWKNEGTCKYFLQPPFFQTIYFFKLTRDRCTNWRTRKRTSIPWINICLSLNHRNLRIRGNIIEVVGKYRDKLTWFIYSQSYLLPLMPDSLN